MNARIIISEAERDMLVQGLWNNISDLRNDIEEYRKNYEDGAPEAVADCRAEIKRHTALIERLNTLKF